MLCESRRTAAGQPTSLISQSRGRGMALTSSRPRPEIAPATPWSAPQPFETTPVHVASSDSTQRSTPTWASKRNAPHATFVDGGGGRYHGVAWSYLVTSAAMVLRPAMRNGARSMSSAGCRRGLDRTGPRPISWPFTYSVTRDTATTAPARRWARVEIELCLQRDDVAVARRVLRPDPIGAPAHSAIIWRRGGLAPRWAPPFRPVQVRPCRVPPGPTWRRGLRPGRTSSLRRPRCVRRRR